jgi:hyperosmotically inducible periplasmic protein
VRIFLALIIGIAIGAGALWLYTSNQGRAAVEATGKQLDSATKPAREAVQAQLRVLDLRPQDVKDELARTGQVVRRKAKEAGQAIADATADSRTTGAIKARLLASHDLSALRISVNTTGGIVTLSGSVNSTEDISKAMLVAMESDGVREVISTLQVKPASGAAK